MIKEDGSVIPTMDEIESDDCTSCNGTGSVKNNIGFVDCATCEGTGVKP